MGGCAHIMTQIGDDGEASNAETGKTPLKEKVEGTVDDWLETLSDGGELGSLLGVPWAEQLERGYGHTLREICQQPLTWRETTETLVASDGDLKESLDGVDALVLAGSGSSLYAAECAAPHLQRVLRRPAVALPTGRVLTHPQVCLPPTGDYLFVSIARSGNSPESRGAVDWLLETQPRARHLVITCNRDGALATAYRDVEKLKCIVLDEKTNDESLAMTSSFTNLVLAARLLGSFGEPDLCRGRTNALARVAASVLSQQADALAAVGRGQHPSVVYLGSGCRLGAAREAALKMLEMTAGKVSTLAESFLGLRHGPMSALRADTLVVAFLSSDPLVRSYDVDLLRELDRKGLGQRRVVVGAEVPPELHREHQLVVDCGSITIPDDDLTLVDALVGQLLAFFRCRAEDVRPDSPSEGGVITRVVSAFEIHARARTSREG
jgi:tagatose-6-phosphate ketose/aldose isomerase